MKPVAWIIFATVIVVKTIALIWLTLLIHGCGVAAGPIEGSILDAGNDGSSWPGSYAPVEAGQPNGPPGDTSPFDNPQSSGTGWGGGGSPSPCGLPPANPCVPRAQ
jgi:hypothetical protein